MHGSQLCSHTAPPRPELQNLRTLSKSKRRDAPTGNRTRVSTVAGLYSTTRPPVLAVYLRYKSSWTHMPTRMSHGLVVGRHLDTVKTPGSKPGGTFLFCVCPSVHSPCAASFHVPLPPSLPILFVCWSQGIGVAALQFCYRWAHTCREAIPLVHSMILPPGHQGV